jgi:hypothetical protein
MAFEKPSGADSAPGCCSASCSRWPPTSSSASCRQWQDIGQLAAIAAIRTFLNYFLEHDLENAAQAEAA